MISEAKRFWDAISGKIKELVRNETSDTLRVRRFDVTTAPDGAKIGVTQPFGDTELMLPYSSEVASASVGDTVLVAWYKSMSNAKAYYYGDGYRGRSIDSIYPVGSIYMSVSSTSPEILFGGTWEQIQNRFLLAAGSSYSAGSTGGEATHALTESEMPSHKHAMNLRNNSGDVTVYPIDVVSGKAYSNQDNWSSSLMAATGGGQAHNNMPPYLAVYVWKRTA